MYWEGEIGAEFAHALAATSRAGVRVRVLLDAWGARPIERSLLAMMDEAGVHAALVSPAPPVPAGPGEPSNAPQGDDRRRGDRLHRWRRHRRRVARQRRERPSQWRDTHFRVAGPGRRRAARRVPRQLGRDRPRAVRRTRRSVPGSTRSRVDRRAMRARRVGDRRQRRLHLVPHAAASSRSNASGSRPRTSCPTPRSSSGSCRQCERGVEVELLLPGPHADKRFVQLASEADVFDAARRRGERSGRSNRRCCTPRS